jgi:H+-translocating NAD(P) transhydrogenase subunit beta
MMGPLLVSLYVFVLAGFLGFELINKVPPTLHTPLMSGANAMSGITVIGALTLVTVASPSVGVVLGRAGADPGHDQRRRRVPGHRPDAGDLRGPQVTTTDLTALLALGSIALFVVGLKRLSRVRTARSGNALMAGGMLLAVLITLLEIGVVDYRWIIAGLLIGGGIGVAIVLRAQATQMPEIVARFNGFGGAGSALVALSLFWLAVVEVPGEVTTADALGGTAAVTLVLSVVIGSATLSGSILAELKLRGTLSKDPRVPARTVVMGALVLVGLGLGMVRCSPSPTPPLRPLAVIGVVVASLLVGVVLVLPIGGADMPVVISLLNSLSGLAAAATGFALSNELLIIAGTIVGAAGLILTQIMCVAMNRSLLNVIAGSFGEAGEVEHGEYGHIVSADAESAAMVLEAAGSVIIVPGYGLAAARAQNAAYDLARALIDRGPRSGSRSTPWPAGCPVT